MLGTWRIFLAIVALNELPYILPYYTVLLLLPYYNSEINQAINQLNFVNLYSKFS